MIDPTSPKFEHLSATAWAAFLERINQTTTLDVYGRDRDFPWIPPLTPRIGSKVPEDGIAGPETDPAVLEPLRAMGVQDVPGMVARMWEKYLAHPEMRDHAQDYRERAELSAMLMAGESS